MTYHSKGYQKMSSTNTLFDSRGKRDWDSITRDRLRRHLKKKVAAATRAKDLPMAVSWTWDAIMEYTLGYRRAGGRISFASIAELSPLQERVTRAHLKALDQAGFITYAPGYMESVTGRRVLSGVRVKVTAEDLAAVMEGQGDPGAHADASPGAHADASPGAHADASPGAHADASQGGTQVHPRGARAYTPGMHADASQGCTQVPLSHEGNHEGNHEETHEGGHEARSARVVGASTSDRHLDEGAGAATDPTPRPRLLSRPRAAV